MQKGSLLLMQREMELRHDAMALPMAAMHWNSGLRVNA
jgi:hypothetical protein